MTTKPNVYVCWLSATTIVQNLETDFCLAQQLRLRLKIDVQLDQMMEQLH